MKNLWLLFFAVSLLSGCGRAQTQTYKAPKESRPPAPVMASAQQESAHSQDVGFEATLPEGWVEHPGSGMRMANYSIEGSSIDFYLISLAMGDVPSNVNRWREQVGLPRAAPEEINAEVETFQVDGREVKYIEIYNEEGGRGIVAAIVDLAPQYWYFTAKGPAGELKTNAADIRKFIESIKMNH